MEAALPLAMVGAKREYKCLDSHEPDCNACTAPPSWLLAQHYTLRSVRDVKGDAFSRQSRGRPRLAKFCAAAQKGFLSPRTAAAVLVHRAGGCDLSLHPLLATTCWLNGWLAKNMAGSRRRTHTPGADLRNSRVELQRYPFSGGASPQPSTSPRVPGRKKNSGQKV